MTKPLLVELLTEELPPKALARLGDSFANTIVEGLRQQGLAPSEGSFEVFATPRRLAVCVAAVREQADDRAVEIKGPSVAVGLDAQGQATLALTKWAEKQGAQVDALTRASDGKQECFYLRSTVAGAVLAQAIQPLIEQAIARLPIPKLMQYQLADGHTSVSFVRPAHGLVVLHGQTVLPAAALGLQSGGMTRGHRFQGESQIELSDATDYERLLSERGRVIASFTRRRERIETLLREMGSSIQPPDVVREIAVYAERTDIAEELKRLSAHVDQFQELLAAKDGKPVGRTLDFLAQEMLREANTIASKSPDAAIARATVEIKGAIDRIKEQVQNLE